MKTQDPKFTIEDNRLHGQSGIVPDDEPLFILRGRDSTALRALEIYFEVVTNNDSIQADHVHALRRRLHDFEHFRDAHPDRMKTPDTNLDQLHDAKL